MGDRVAAMNASGHLTTCLSVAGHSAFLSGDTIRPFPVSPSRRFSLDFYESGTDTKPLLQGVSRMLTTANYFGRNFPTNGRGPDHGWGSHHLVVGGSVKGNAMDGSFPTPMVNGPDDAGEGR